MPRTIPEHEVEQVRGLVRKYLSLAIPVMADLFTAVQAEQQHPGAGYAMSEQLVHSLSHLFKVMVESGDFD